MKKYLVFLTFLFAVGESYAQIPPINISCVKYVSDEIQTNGKKSFVIDLNESSPTFVDFYVGRTLLKVERSRNCPGSKILSSKTDKVQIINQIVTKVDSTLVAGQKLPALNGVDTYEMTSIVGTDNNEIGVLYRVDRKLQKEISYSDGSLSKEYKTTITLKLVPKITYTTSSFDFDKNAGTVSVDIDPTLSAVLTNFSLDSSLTRIKRRSSKVVSLINPSASLVENRLVISSISFSKLKKGHAYAFKVDLQTDTGWSLKGVGPIEALHFGSFEIKE